MNLPAEPGARSTFRWRSLVWTPLAWLWRVSVAVTVLCLRFCWWCLIPVRKLMAPLKQWSWWKRNVSSLRLRSVPLRRWLVLSLILLVVLPLIAGGIAAVLVNIDGDPRDSRAADVIGSQTHRWSDPAWQAEATAQLQERGMEFILFENGREIYRSTEHPSAGEFGHEIQQLEFDAGGVERFAIVYGDEWVPFDEEDDAWPVPVAVVLTLLLTFIGLGIFFGRTVVKPLAASSLAAGDIAGGDLDIKLPGSRVREVAELNAAIEGMARALSDSLAQEAKLEEERKLFIGAVAHDLRTPLFSLRGSLEAIRTGVADTDEKRDRYLATAQEKANALDRLISDLFDFTRLEFLEQTPKQEPVAFGELVRRCVDALQPLAEQRNVTLTVEDRSEGALVSGDGHLLTRAIDNIVDNAIRFSPPDGSASVECARDGDNVVLVVSDSGPGIPEEDLGKIFQPLYRGEGSRNRRTGGAGLGLTIARNAFVAHGGDLRAMNRPEGGAVFIASIPLLPSSGQAR